MEVSAGQTVTSIREMSPFKRWLTTTCLVVFTMIVAAICIVLLASTLTQSRLAFSVDGAQITVRKIDFVAREWGRHRVDREQKGWATLAAELQSRKLRQELADAQRQFAPVFNQMERLLVEFNLKIQHSEPVLFEATNKKGHDVQVIRIGAEKDRLIKDHPELEQLLQKIEKTYESYPSLQSGRDEARRKVEENIAIFNDLLSSANAADTGVGKSFELIKPNLDQAERLRAESAFLELGIEDYLKSGDGSMNIFRRAIAVMWNAFA